MIVIAVNRINLNLIGAAVNFNFSVKIAGIISMSGVIIGVGSNNNSAFGIGGAFDSNFGIGNNSLILG